jgi:glycosyltransferase involved in cell wall biosynthesis
MIKVSIIIPCFNSIHFIEESITSAIMQTYKNIEIIVVDDCSTDGSLNLIKHLALKDTRIKVISTPINSGASAARNIALKHAKGLWISVLDSDDIYCLDKIEKQVESIEKYSGSLVAVGSNSYHIDTEGRIISYFKYPKNSKILVKNLIRMKRFPAHSSFMYLLSAVKKINGYNENCKQAEDTDLMLRLSEHGDFTIVSDYLIKYRIHDNNMTNYSNGDEQLHYALATRVYYQVQVDTRFQTQYEINWNSIQLFVFNSLYFNNLKTFFKKKKEFKVVVKEFKGSFGNKIRFINFIAKNYLFIYSFLLTRFFGDFTYKKIAKDFLRSYVYVKK